MLILKDKPGKLCNRLWAFSHFVSDALENNYKLRILHFYDYYQYFENLEKFKNISFNKAPRKHLFFLIRMLQKIKFNTLFVHFNEKKSGEINDIKTRLVFVNSWNLQRPYKPLRLDNLQELFRPKLRYTNRVDKIFDENRRDTELVIGVHIRRGDYKEFYNGRYFYTDFDYNNFLSQLRQEFSSEIRIKLLLCSDEKIDIDKYSDFPVFQIDNANLIEDLYGLSKCDYIIGPPSTYSMWASFYGQKPILAIENKSCIVKKMDFSIAISINKLSNGYTFIWE
jgi:hypothetical protein